MKQYKRVGWGCCSGEFGQHGEDYLGVRRNRQEAIGACLQARVGDVNWATLKNNGYSCISLYADTDDLKGQKK